MRLSIRCTVGLVGFALLASPALGDEPFYYPEKGQSSEQVEKDRSECQVWAKGQTGFDPTAPPPVYDAAAADAAQASKRGSAVRGAARGAAVGAIGGAIAGDAGEGAAVGAGVGAAGGRMRAGRQARAVESQAHGQYEQQMAAYNEQRASWQRAVSACMSGRDYSVK